MQQTIKNPTSPTRYSVKLVPFTPLSTISVSVEIGCELSNLYLTYRIDGDLSNLVFEKLSPNPKRKDQLWLHSCAELFCGNPGVKHYHEYNFSFSGSWNCYSFAAERIGCEEVECKGIDISTQIDTKSAELNLSLPISSLPFQTGNVALILKHLDGSRSFWTVEHLQDKPNFHDSRLFSLPLFR